MFDIKQSVADYMSVVVTHECNMACSFCIDQYRGRNEYISSQSVESAITLGKLRGIRDILLIGGEPTLHPEIVNIARRFKAEGFRVIMTTNYTRPDVVRSLDGIVDCFNISFYDQPDLPTQLSFESDLTFHALIYKGRLDSMDAIDSFIDKYQHDANLKFSTLFPGNPWAKRNQVGGFLDDAKLETVVLFDEIIGNLYRGAVIKRYDRIINDNARQSIKFHVDGSHGYTWDREDR